MASPIDAVEAKSSAVLAFAPFEQHDAGAVAVIAMGHEVAVLLRATMKRAPILHGLGDR
jgi:hypothetical protein